MLLYQLAKYQQFGSQVALSGKYKLRVKEIY